MTEWVSEWVCEREDGSVGGCMSGVGVWTGARVDE